MKYYLVQVKTSQQEEWQGKPIREVIICRQCAHFVKRMGGKHFCSLTDSVVYRYSFCSKGERKG